MLSVHLNKLTFFAHHGLHGEESVVGANFEVSLTVSIEPQQQISSIKQTVDYCVLYKIIQTHMKKPLYLLETLAENIADEIGQTDPRIVTIELRIIKLQPPIAGFSGEAGITLTKALAR